MSGAASKLLETLAMRLSMPRSCCLLSVLSTVALISGCAADDVEHGCEADDCGAKPDAGDVAAGSLPSQRTTIDLVPQTVLAPGVPLTGFDQNVVALGSVSLPMTATQTAYVVGTMRVSSATIRSLFDDEVVCTGPSGWRQNVVFGQNVYPVSTHSQFDDVTLTSRFLVHPGVAETITCTANIRTASLGYAAATVRLVSGNLRFADTSIDNDSAGAPVQASVPAGVLRVDAASPTVREPSTDYFELGDGFTGLSVFGDIEFLTCAPGTLCNKTGASNARFTLVVNQWKADGTLCHSDASTSVTRSVPYAVHHAFVPLNTPNFAIQTGGGCIRRFNAYVRTTWLSGETGAVQGMAKGLTNTRQSIAKHDSDMSHLFAVPY